MDMYILSLDKFIHNIDSTSISDNNILDNIEYKNCNLKFTTNMLVSDIYFCFNGINPNSFNIKDNFNILFDEVIKYQNKTRNNISILINIDNLVFENYKDNILYMLKYLNLYFYFRSYNIIFYCSDFYFLKLIWDFLCNNEYKNNIYEFFNTLIINNIIVSLSSNKLEDENSDLFMFLLNSFNVLEPRIFYNDKFHKFVNSLTDKHPPYSLDHIFLKKIDNYEYKFRYLLFSITYAHGDDIAGSIETTLPKLFDYINNKEEINSCETLAILFPIALFDIKEYITFYTINFFKAFIQKLKLNNLTKLKHIKLLEFSDSKNYNIFKHDINSLFLNYLKFQDNFYYEDDHLDEILTWISENHNNIQATVINCQLLKTSLKFDLLKSCILIKIIDNKLYLIDNMVLKLQYISVPAKKNNFHIYSKFIKNML